MAPKAYISKSKFLADINMEGPKPNKTYAKNLKKLEKLVLVMYENVSGEIIKTKSVFNLPHSDTFSHILRVNFYKR